MNWKLIIAAAAIAVTTGGVSWAGSYPEKSIKVIVPNKPGGITDSNARLFQKELDGVLPMTVINVPGGGTTIGAREVKDAKPDGYTVLLNHIAIISAQASGIVDFGPSDFEPIAGTVDFCHIVVVPKDSEIKDLPDLLARAKANPDSVRYGVNIGAILHMIGLLFEDEEPGAAFRFVQVGGEAPQIQALLAGTTDAAAFTLNGYNKFQNEFRPLALLSDERDPRFPDMPTAKEQGIDVSFCVQHYWLAPKGTPLEHRQVIADALQKVMQSDSVKEALDARSSSPTFTPMDKLAAKMESEKALIADVAPRAMAAKK